MLEISTITLLKNDELNFQMKTLALQERKFTKQTLEYIAEVDRRKLYLGMAYPSLFEYLTKEIGYSAGAAHRRIDAARLIQKLPEVANKISSGDLNLAQISKLQQFCRQIKKDSKIAVSVETQKIILQKIEGQTSPQTEVILARELNTKLKISETKRLQKDESVHVHLNFSKSEYKLLQQAQQLLSHSSGGQLKETILNLAKRLLQAQSKKAMHSGYENMSENLKSVTPKLRASILKRDQFCQFTDHKTGKICGSKFYLEVDHIQPRFAGGNNSVTNVRILCKNHNIFRYQHGK